MPVLFLFLSSKQKIYAFFFLLDYTALQFCLSKFMSHVCFHSKLSDITIHFQWNSTVDCDLSRTNGQARQSLKSMGIFVYGVFVLIVIKHSVLKISDIEGPHMCYKRVC